MHGKRILARATGLIVAVLVGVMGVPAAASATDSDVGAYSENFWDGAGEETDDFGDHFDEIGGSLCNGCANSSNTGSVRAWQAMLFADGILTSGTAIDGQFGPNTQRATIAWQQRYSDLQNDGMVGDATWSKADNKLDWNSPAREYIIYNGSTGYVTFERGNSLHGNRNGDGAYRILQACQHQDRGTACRNLGSQRIYHFQ